MKRVILLLSIGMMTTIAMQAQKNVRFILTPGLSVSKLDISPVEGDIDIKSKIGFDGGVGAEFVISRYFSIQPEVNFSMQGLEASDVSSTTTISLNYLTVPILAKVKPVAGLNIFAGPQIGFLLKSELKATNQDKQDLKEILKSTDLFAVFGVEYQLPAGFFIGARYNLGLTNIVDSDDLDTELKNRGFAFRVGYSFPLGK